jgi:hypothetical protein
MLFSECFLTVFDSALALHFFMTHTKVNATRIRRGKKEVSEALKSREKGLTYREIAKSSTRSTSFVHNVCRREPTRENRIENELKIVENAILELREQFPRKKCIGCALIARHLDWTVDTVKRRLRTLGMVKGRCKMNGKRLENAPSAENERRVAIFWILN